MDNDADDPANEFKPPPKLSELMPKMGPPQSQAHSTPNSNTSMPTFDPNRTLTANGGVPMGNSSATVTDDQGNVNSMPTPGNNMFKLQKGRSKYWQNI